MAFQVFDRVKETSTTSGSGTITLAGAVNSFQAFSGVYSDGDTTHYVIVNGGQWEAGLGTYSANTLSRDVVFESSNGGNKISLLNSSTVFVSYPAARSVLAESSSLNKSGVPYINTSGHIASNTGITYNPTSYSLSVAGNVTANTGVFNGITISSTNNSGIAFFNNNQLLNTSSFLYDSGNKRVGINQSSPDANLHIVTSNATIPAAIFEATAGQSSNLTEWHDLNGNTVAYVDKSGDAYFNNVQVTGTLTYISTDTLTVQDKNIELASTSGSPLGDDTLVDGGGITLLSSDGNKTITWNNSSNSWNFNQNIDLDNGYSLTINDYTLPAADGSSDHIIKTNGSGTLSFVDVGTLVYPASPSNSVQFNNSGNFDGSADLVWSGQSLNINGWLDTSGYSIRAHNFHGEAFYRTDGSDAFMFSSTSGQGSRGFGFEGVTTSKFGNKLSSSTWGTSEWYGTQNVVDSNGIYTLSNIGSGIQLSSQGIGFSNTTDARNIYSNGNIRGSISTGTGGELLIKNVSTSSVTVAVQTPSGHTNNAFETKNYAGATGVYIDTSGNLFANSKSFLIQHPLKEGKQLRHVSLEGDEHGVYTRGKLDNTKYIDLPDYWLGLVNADSITVHLTPSKMYFVQPYVKTVTSARIELSKNFTGSYIIYGTRKDVPQLKVEI